MKVILKIVVLLWAAFFGVLAVRGVIDPTVYRAQFGFPEMTGEAINTIRADISSFFIVSSVAAAWGALVAGRSALLYIPAALFGTALVGRGLGGLLGDGFGPMVTTSMAVEAVSILLMVGAARALAQPR